MLRLIPKTNIDFVGKRYIFFSISITLVLGTILAIIFHKGLNLGIDFTGGTLIQVSFNQKVASEQIRNALAKGGFKDIDIQSIPEHNGYIMRIKKGELVAQELANQVFSSLKLNLQQNLNINLERVEYVGPTVGRHLVYESVMAIILSFLGIIVYVGFRFRNLVWGVTGVVALLHDVVTTIGVLSIFNREITVTIIAALLTIAGYSINDTIVIFDRMRERARMYRKESLYEAVNIALNETLSRTIITSSTVFMAVVALFFWGGDVLHDFALAMLWGTLVGVYSTLAIAVPGVYEWKKRQGAAGK